MIKARKINILKPMFKMFQRLYFLFQNDIFLNINYQKDLKLAHF